MNMISELIKSSLSQPLIRCFFVYVCARSKQKAVNYTSLMGKLVDEYQHPLLPLQ
jgi:hypothetical protein